MAAPAQRLDFKQARVLIVDNNAQALDILSQVLLGFSIRNVTSCRSAEEATPHLDKLAHDLLIIDMEMPNEDGFALIQRIRSHEAGPNFTAPVIAVSGFTPLGKVMKARDCGANLVVSKPIVPNVLLGHIEWLARNPRDFVQCSTYVGPDRRFHILPLPDGVTERRAEALRMMAQPERELSQGEIDSVFG